MKKLVTAFFVLVSFSLSAQTIFHYGNDSVSTEDFLRAYQKNNTGVKNEKALRDYLDLYITSRLKIKEAKERGYDTLPQIIADLESLRQQILPSYLNDKEATNKLVNEAFVRSQKDIHLAHIFISARQGNADEVDASKKKLAEVLAELEKSKTNRYSNFEELAKKYSDDPAAKINGGDLGWITVFSLPYPLENLAYVTAIGKISTVYQSTSGYHIFKNLGEKRDQGKMKAAQILLAFPPNAKEETKLAIKKLADSVYNRLQKGDDFGKLATQFSNDVVSAAANGQMQEFGIGQYEPTFENIVFALTANGAITKPFLTTHGYHIVKRISKTPVSTVKNEKTLHELQLKVEQTDRNAIVKNELVKKMLKNIGITETNFSPLTIWAYSDSILNYQPPKTPSPITNTSVLFQVGDKKITAADWISFAQSFRYKQDGTGLKTYPQLFNEFTEALAVEYYQNHLEDFNEEFRRQLNEFREGNLFFEIMQRQVWGPVQSDSVSLENFYNENKSRYNWKQSADAVIFYATDAASAKTFRDQLVKSPASWNVLLQNFSEKIAADSSRFELTQIPNPTKQSLKPGTVTALSVNNMDKSTSFAYIIRQYNLTEPRSFAEARGLVINDYQAELEKNWIAELHKKYPVQINQKVVSALVKSKQF